MSFLGETLLAPGLVEDGFLWRRVAVSLSGLVYWGGVAIQARRVRKRIGRAPNLKPKGTKERLLWAGWTLVILGWILQPLWAGGAGPPGGFAAVAGHPAAPAAGLALLLLGYAVLTFSLTEYRLYILDRIGSNCAPFD